MGGGGTAEREAAGLRLGRLAARVTVDADFERVEKEVAVVWAGAGVRRDYGDSAGRTQAATGSECDAMTPTTDEFTNKDIVLFALYEVGGAERAVHTENVAARVFEYPLGRQRYRWERFEYPDKERVARELRRLKQYKGISYVTGHVNIGAVSDRTDGWMLTADGVDRVNAVKETLQTKLGSATGTHSKYAEVALRQRLLATSCYKGYLSDPTLKSARDHDLTDMLFCLPDAPAARIKAAHERLLAQAKAVSAQDLVDFLGIVRQRFARFFTA